MKTTIKEELTAYINNLINDRVLTEENKDEWHYLAFNQDYYMIYYYEASEWLKRHEIDPFEAIEIVINYNQDNFGENNTDINSVSIVNMLVYIYGEELIYSCETIEELKNL
jgi:hypothetical protein